MAIPIEIWLAFVSLATICTGYSWLSRDLNNYTDAIAGLVATLLWFVSGTSCLIGVQTKFTTFTAGYGFWIFAFVGAIEGIITVVKILDIATARSKQTYTSLDHIHL